jgi:hypothetical protein
MIATAEFKGRDGPVTLQCCKCDVCDLVFGVDVASGDMTDTRPAFTTKDSDSHLCQDCYERAILYAARNSFRWVPEHVRSKTETGR